MDSIRSLDQRQLALAGGLAYALTVPLVGTQADTDPVGAQYDAFNRILAVALAIVAVSAVTVRTRIKRAGLSGQRPATALVVGFGMMALGSMLEFWGSLIAGAPGSATADRTGEEAFAAPTPASPCSGSARSWPSSPRWRSRGESAAGRQ